MPDRSLRETYDLPEKPPVPARQWALMVLVPLLVLALWFFVLPHSALTVALLAVVMLVVVFTGVRLVLSSRALHDKPGRNPARPPSTQ
jgi:hypothetical protein